MDWTYPVECLDRLLLQFFTEPLFRGVNEIGSVGMDGVGAVAV